MDDRLGRIGAALAGVKTKIEAGRAAAQERDTLQTRLDALAAKWQALLDATYWAELDSGKSIQVGDQVRYFGRQYRCIQAHKKALLRSPINNEYWELTED